MDRRKFLAGSSAVVSTALAGCTNDSSTPQSGIESISDTGTNLVVGVSNPGYADHITFDVEDGENLEAPISEKDPTGTYSIGDPETLGTREQKLNHETEIEIILYGTDGADIESTTWTFEPNLELTNVVHSREADYTPENHAQGTTPVFEITNTGTGPTRIGQLVVLNISQNVPLADSNAETGFAKALLAEEPKGGRLQPVATREEREFLIASGESATFAADGLLTHTGEPPKSIESAKQSFDVEIRWLFGDLRYTVDTKLTGGVSQRNGEKTYRFGDYEIVGFDETSPLR